MTVIELKEWLELMVECGQLTGTEEVLIHAGYYDPDIGAVSNYIEDLAIDREDGKVTLYGL